MRKFRKLNDPRYAQTMGVYNYPSTPMEEFRKSGERTDIEKGRYYLRVVDDVYDIYPNVSLFTHRNEIADLFHRERETTRFILLEDFQMEPFNSRHSGIYLGMGLVLTILDGLDDDGLRTFGFNYACFQKNLNSEETLRM